MTTWFTADLHLGHSNIIGYSRRPFPDVDAMNAALVAAWNDVVADGDTVWVLGDLALGRIDDTLGLVGELRGHKILLAGNHDRCWSGHGHRAGGWTQRYLDAGFEAVLQGTANIEIADQRVLLCHFPYHGDSRDRDRYVEHRPADRDRWLLHGHVHERWGQNDRMVNVGVDATGYRPVSQPEIAALIDAGPTHRDRIA